jgi:NADH-quinone oxidoreductase subunit M
LGNFVGEFLVLLGTYQVDPLLTALATLGFIVSTVYSLWIVQRAFHGPNSKKWQLLDMSLRESVIMGSMVIIIVLMGLFPQTILNTSRRALEDLQLYTTRKQEAAAPASPVNLARSQPEDPSVILRPELFKGDTP